MQFYIGIYLDLILQKSRIYFWGYRTFRQIGGWREEILEWGDGREEGIVLIGWWWIGGLFGESLEEWSIGREEGDEIGERYSALGGENGVLIKMIFCGLIFLIAGLGLLYTYILINLKFKYW